MLIFWLQKLEAQPNFAVLVRSHILFNRQRVKNISSIFHDWVLRKLVTENDTAPRLISQRPFQVMRVEGITLNVSDSSFIVLLINKAINIVCGRHIPHYHQVSLGVTMVRVEAFLQENLNRVYRRISEE